MDSMIPMKAPALILLVAGLLFFTLVVTAVQADGELHVTVTPGKYTLDAGETLYLTATVTRNGVARPGAEVFFSRVRSDGADVAVLSGWQKADSGTVTVAVPTDNLPTGGPVEFYARARYGFTDIDTSAYTEWTGFGTTTVTIHEPVKPDTTLTVTLMPDRNPVYKGGDITLTAAVTRNNAPLSGADVIIYQNLPDGYKGLFASGQTTSSGTFSTTVSTRYLPPGPFTFRADATYDSGRDSQVARFIYSGSGYTVVTILPPGTTVEIPPPVSTVQPAIPASTIPPRECYVGPLPCIWIPIIIVVIIVLFVLRPHEPPGPTPEKPPASKGEKTPEKDTRQKQEDTDRHPEDGENGPPDGQSPQILSLHVSGGIGMKGDTSALAGLRLVTEGGIDHPEKKERGGR
jgi:hypothetical protein